MSYCIEFEVILFVHACTSLVMISNSNQVVYNLIIMAEIVLCFKIDQKRGRITGAYQIASISQVHLACGNTRCKGDIQLLSG